VFSGRLRSPPSPCRRSQRIKNATTSSCNTGRPTPRRPKARRRPHRHCCHGRVTPQHNLAPWRLSASACWAPLGLLPVPQAPPCPSWGGPRQRAAPRNQPAANRVRQRHGSWNGGVDKDTCRARMQSSLCFLRVCAPGREGGWLRAKRIDRCSHPYGTTRVNRCMAAQRCLRRTWGRRLLPRGSPVQSRERHAAQTVL